MPEWPGPISQGLAWERPGKAGRYGARRWSLLVRSDPKRGALRRENRARRGRRADGENVATAC